MTNVCCHNTDCVYIDIPDNCCTKNYITLDEYAEYGCQDYTDFRSLPEYQEEYWITVNIEKDKNKFGRVKEYGKRLEINGVEVFTKSNIKLADEDIMLTDKETGYFCGSAKYVKGNWEKLLSKKEETKKKIPNLMELPICEYCYNKKCYVIKDKNQ